MTLKIGDLIKTRGGRLLFVISTTEASSDIYTCTVEILCRNEVYQTLAKVIESQIEMGNYVVVYANK